jgi:hypothetical protein
MPLTELDILANTTQQKMEHLRPYEGVASKGSASTPLWQVHT